ncbi:SpdA protein [Streptomyces violaceusniger]|uniref:DUF2637 domain-containing protein n=2 Tax=Streptomyces violaceusniger group TaxID=2839105 RepID=A0ABD5JKQ5_9ACTN|nr:DUF2637 domain-containing protein [Streptomyces violaceusniger]KUL47685.1 SpdA protein [Streptomyces violaceusniger]MEE4589010.1 DUF2637 domain-containing protein [Streptomyces sp. DSM 41602]
MSEDRITQRTVTVVMGIIAALAFVFSFGNVWALALRLGVPAPVAPLIAPMVDLSVVGLLVALRYLSLRGVPAEQIKGATRLMHVSGLLTLALNVAEPIVAGHYGRAAVDAVAPLLLLGWGAVGPQLLRHFHTVAHTAPTPDPAAPGAPAEKAPAPAPEPGTASEPVSPRVGPILESAPAVTVPVPLLNAARTIADTYRAEHGEPITPAQLRTRLGVALPLATAAHAQL